MCTEDDQINLKAVNDMKKYYIVQSDNYAKTIHFLSGIPYYTFPDKKIEGGIVYSFENSEKLQEVLSLINKTIKKYRTQ